MASAPPPTTTGSDTGRCHPTWLRFTTWRGRVSLDRVPTHWQRLLDHVCVVP